MAKHVLNTGTENLEFLLIGLMTQENRYSLVSKVNGVLGVDLALSENVPFNLKPGSIFHFSLFSFTDESLGLEYLFIPNTSNLEPGRATEGGQTDLFSETQVEESARLIKELPKTDHFLIVKGENLHMFQFRIIERLKTIREIIQVQNIEPKDLPSRMNLVF